MSISLDYGYMLAEVVGEYGNSFEAVQKQARDWSSVQQKIQEQKQKGELGFTELPYNKETVAEVETLAEQVRKECDDLIVIGIGGSDLGARAVHRALNHQFYNQLPEEKRGGPRIFFVGDTTDPVALQEVLDVVNLAKTIVVIISKSGNTIEQMSVFTHLYQKLKAAVPEDQLSKRIIAITDAEKGTLRELVSNEGYRSLSIPDNVGGRFSVFATVGLFVLAVAGIEIKELLKGAAAMDQHDRERSAEKNMPFVYALLQHAAYRDHGQNISVLMPYTYSLREVGFWFRQLWAESLGKKVNLKGEVVEYGPTPIAAVGPTDQHSQMQLYIEGPHDKVVTFIRIEETVADQTLPALFPEIDGIHYLGGHRFQEILLAEQQASAYALAQGGRPSVTISLEYLDAFHLGALLYFFELATTYMGAFLEVNTFDQPGVELGKQYMYGILGREGFTAPEFPKLPDESKIAL